MSLYSPVITLNSLLSLKLDNTPQVSDPEIYEALLNIHDAIHYIISQLTDVNDSIIFGIDTVSVDTILTPQFYFYTLLVDATAGNVTITLPIAADSYKRVFNIKKIDSSSNSVIVEGNGAETIDGDANFSLLSQDESITVQSNSTAFYII